VEPSGLVVACPVLIECDNTFWIARTTHCDPVSSLLSSSSLSARILSVGGERMKRVLSVSELTIGLVCLCVWSVPHPRTPMWGFGTKTILEVTGSTRYVTISFLSSWSHLLLFAIVFYTSGTFSASFPVNMFLPPSNTIIELFRTLCCMWYWCDIRKCNVSCTRFMMQTEVVVGQLYN